MEDVDPVALAMLIRRRNLRRAFQLASVEQWSAEDRNHLYAACFSEWGPDWINKVQEA